MSEATAICFDLDGTLVQYEADFDTILAGVLKRELGTATGVMAEAYEEGFFSAFDALDAAPYHAGMGATLDAAGIEATEETVDALVTALQDAELGATTVPQAVHDCLTELSDDDATTVAVVTDGVGEWQRAKIEHHDLGQYLDETIVSYGVGGHKTSGEPYAAARERLDAEEYVMVGDDYEADVEAAQATGFSAIHYEDAAIDLFETFDAML